MDKIYLKLCEVCLAVTNDTRSLYADHFWKHCTDFKCRVPHKLQENLSQERRCWSMNFRFTTKAFLSDAIP